MNFLKLLPSFWLFHFVQSSLNITREPSSSLKTCVHRISHRFLAPESVWLTSTTYDLFDAKYLQNLMLEGHSISTRTSQSNLNNVTKEGFWLRTENYIIEANNVAGLANTLFNFRHLRSWNPQAKFFIVVKTEVVLPEMVERLWYDGINNFILLTTDGHANEKVNVYTWYPYRCKHGVDFRRLQLLDVCTNGVFRNRSDLFPGKIPKVFKFCELRVGTVEWPPYVMKPSERLVNTDQYIIKEGLEIRIVDTIGAKLHMNVSYTMSEKALNWGELFDNGTGTGLMALLRQKKVDIAVAALTPSLPRFKYFEATHSYFLEKFFWCVPHANAQPNWKKIFNALRYELWLAQLFSFVAVSLLMWWLSRITNRETLYKSYIHCLQASMAVALGIAVASHPKTHVLRWILGLWLIFSLNFSVFYETKLTSILTKPTFDYQIKSLDGILQHDLSILLPINMLNIKDNCSLNRVLKKSQDCTDMKECFSRVVHDKDSALYLSSSYAHYMKRSFVNRENIPLIFCFPSKMATYPIIALMKKGFPLAPLFNEIISRLVEGGFVNMWAEQIYKHKWRVEEVAKVNSTNENKLLNMGRLKGAFVFLFWGLFVSTCVFLVEVGYFLVGFLKGKRIFIV